MLTSELKITLISQLNAVKKRLEDRTVDSQVTRTPSILSQVILQNEHQVTICLICRNYIQNKQKIITYSKCKTVYHVNHIADWLIVKNSCPICDEYIPLIHIH